jgi:hypothetical protein
MHRMPPALVCVGMAVRALRDRWTSLWCVLSLAVHCVFFVQSEAGWEGVGVPAVFSCVPRPQRPPHPGKWLACPLPACVLLRWLNRESRYLLFAGSSLLFLLFVLAAFCRKSCLRLCFARHPACSSSPTMWRLGASRAAPNEQPRH